MNKQLWRNQNVTYRRRHLYYAK